MDVDINLHYVFLMHAFIFKMKDFNERLLWKTLALLMTLIADGTIILEEYLTFPLKFENLKGKMALISQPPLQSISPYQCTSNTNVSTSVSTSSPSPSSSGIIHSSLITLSITEQEIVTKSFCESSLWNHSLGI